MAFCAGHTKKHNGEHMFFDHNVQTFKLNHNVQTFKLDKSR